MIKRILFFAFAVSLFTVSAGCNKEKEVAITYPADGAYGKNVLALPNSEVINNGEGYSLSAELGKKAELKIVITNLSTTGAVWFYAENNGWAVSDHSATSQDFISIKDGLLDLNIVFENGPGSCRVDYYENSNTVTNSKTFTW